LSNTNSFVMRVLVPLILVLSSWATLAFIYAGQFVPPTIFLVYIGFILILLLRRTRSIKIKMRRTEK
jgi:NADH:ubiquinone oxidoreductase subunit 6 (subunit J)